MRALFKVGTMPARYYTTCKIRKPPTVGQVFTIVDKQVHGSKPFRVVLDTIRTHVSGGDIYFVQSW